jgi:hypothetical protein
MTTVATIITDAMYAAQIIGQDQTPSSGDSQLMLRILQRMLDSWSNENQLIYADTTESFTMTAGVSAYSTTLLTDGRPVSINAMTVTLNDIYYPVDMIDVLTWNAITYKLTQSIPNQCYYDPTFPNGTFNFYPTPYAAFTCYVDARYPLSGTLTLATDLVLPEGYEAAIVANLAIKAWPSFKTGNPSPLMMQEARDTRAVIKRTNYVPLEMETPFGNSSGDISNSLSLIHI